MNFELFVVKRLINANKDKSSISSPIIKIAITAIAIGVIMMLVSFATGLGLQGKIRDKIAAFNGHIIVTNYDNNNSEITLEPVSKDQDFYPDFNTVEGIKHVQATATKAGIIRTAEDFEGVVVKGVGEDYDWSYFKDFLVEGKLPDYSSNLNDEVLISRYLADRLHLNIGDRAPTYFVREGRDRPFVRGFKI